MRTRKVVRSKGHAQWAERREIAKAFGTRTPTNRQLKKARALARDMDMMTGPRGEVKL